MTEKELKQQEMTERELVSINQWLAKYFYGRKYRVKQIEKLTTEVTSQDKVVLLEYEYAGEIHNCILICRLADGYVIYQDGLYTFLPFPIVNGRKFIQVYDELPPKI